MLQQLWLCRKSDRPTVSRGEIDSQWHSSSVTEHAMVIVSPLRRTVDLYKQSGNVRGINTLCHQYTSIWLLCFDEINIKV